MARNVVVEVSHLLRKDGGGIGRKRLTTGLGRLREAHEALRAGAESSKWPHLRVLDDETVAYARAVAEGLRARGTELAVVGQPGAVAALRALTDALGVASPRWVTGPDDALVAALDRPEVAWLVLEGPAWADRVAEWAVEQGRAVAVAGPGDHEAPPGGWWLSDPVAGDGRFGVLGLAAAVCAAWAGVDVEGLFAGARDMAEACERAALFENPAYTLALATIFAERDLGATVPAHLVASGRMGAFSEWVARLWGAILCDAVHVEGVVRHSGAVGVPGVVGDEELLQALVLGPRDKLVTLWDPTEATNGPLAQEAAAQARAFQDLLERENVPYVRVRLPGLDARSLGAAVFLATHAAVSAAVYLDVDPLGLGAVSAWYASLERARGDVDAGPATA